MLEMNIQGLNPLISNKSPYINDTEPKFLLNKKTIKFQPLLRNSLGGDTTTSTNLAQPFMVIPLISVSKKVSIRPRKLN